VTLDQFLARNAPTWAKLEELTRHAGSRARRLRAEDIDELLRLYQLTSTHLSYASSNFSDPGLTIRLSQLVAQAGALIYGTRARSLRAFAAFFTVTLPAALWHVKRFLLVSAALVFLPAIGFGIWLANSPKAIDATAPAAVRQAYINHDFAEYYRAAPSAQFATQVYTNNVVVSGEAFGLGAALCVPGAYVLITNGANLGVAGGLFTAAGQSTKFWGLVTPHGLIELTSVVIAGAAGLRVGWSIIDPGDRTRRTALMEEGRRAVVLFFGTVFTLAIAGTIEGFVTGSSFPTVVRVGIGVTVEVLFLTYAFVLGRRASKAGYTGMIGERTTGWAAHLGTRAGQSPAGQSRPVALTER
jgi:uncharacterized membrane protein SpoIIM required for sporulation